MFYPWSGLGVRDLLVLWTLICLRASFKLYLGVGVLDLFLLAGEASVSFTLSRSDTFLNYGEYFFLEAPCTLVFGLVDLTIFAEAASLLEENALAL